MTVNVWWAAGCTAGDPLPDLPLPPPPSTTGQGSFLSTTTNCFIVRRAARNECLEEAVARVAGHYGGEGGRQEGQGRLPPPLVLRKWREVDDLSQRSGWFPCCCLSTYFPEGVKSHLLPSIPHEDPGGGGRGRESPGWGCHLPPRHLAGE